MNSGDAAFILISAAMVFFMTPALAIFYAGLVRRKNAMDTMAQTLLTVPVVTIIWVLFGFSLAFSGDLGGLIGNLDLAFLQGVSFEPLAAAPTIPGILFFTFQLMFAIITPALIAGAIVERTTLKSYLIFAGLWSVLVYIPVCHWAWGGGFLSALGAADFAGGTVVHMSAGFSALAAALVYGKRRNDDTAPQSNGFVAVGVAILWFGWLTFNGGSALAANGTAAYAMVNSVAASATGLMVWCILTRVQEKRISVLGAMFGALAGLIVVTPAAGLIEVWAALIFGMVGALVSYCAVNFRTKRGIDDTLDVWALHGVSGMTGLILLGFFASPAVGGFTGLLYGNATQLLWQLVAVAVTGVYAFVVSFVLLKIIGKCTALRVPAATEDEGIDSVLYDEKFQEN